MTTERQQYLVTIESNQRGLLNYEHNDHASTEHATLNSPHISLSSPLGSQLQALQLQLDQPIAQPKLVLNYIQY